MNWDAINKLSIGPDVIRKLKVDRTDEQWRASLAEDIYRITRLSATERPFSSTLCQSFEPGRYDCACCNLPLFDASLKFDSGTGWPSFSGPVAEERVVYVNDHSHGMQRIEVRCHDCDAHLGHVFPDGPEPSGLRYCINALALEKS
ncbi:MAG: peptide-methionine (R)-S-oxide reductase MsrB [Gammaproteobacteria bacterium]|nr:peptide-methionine (R)-S-oxide reductase MsrB [Gammaproteobacteria bacterium]